jgi:8-oxo-dGTP diphosphatase
VGFILFGNLENNFNIRVYGLLIHEEKLLVAHEYDFNRHFTKLPGGGLERGESTIDCLKREFMEECGIEIEILEHFYTTDFYVESLFDDRQLISIYYLVESHQVHLLKTEAKQQDALLTQNNTFYFRWADYRHEKELFTFPVDKHVHGLLRK